MQNPGKLLKGLADMQKRMSAAQDKLAATEFAGTSAGGMVKAVVNGKGELKSLFIDPTVMSEGSEMVADLVQAAYNVANTEKEKAAKAVLGSMTSGLLPFGMKIPGLG